MDHRPPLTFEVLVYGLKDIGRFLVVVVEFRRLGVSLLPATKLLGF
jgi:hypothetical protein